MPRSYFGGNVFACVICAALAAALMAAVPGVDTVRFRKVRRYGCW